MGSSGLKVSELSFGSWVTFGSQIGDNVAEECMKVAYDAGINFFDNAETYASGKSEIVMGNILKKMGWDRTTYIVSSKVFWGGKLPNQYGLSRKHVFEACHAALKRLQVDYLDLFFCHRPDPETPVEETVRAMTDLIRQGKVLYWGTSEWEADRIMQAYGVARQYGLVPPTMEQPQYNLLHRERVEKEYARLYSEIGLGTTIWSPLASGLLTGKYNEGMPSGTRTDIPAMNWLKEKFKDEKGKQRIETVKKLTKLAKEAGISVTHLSLLWCLKNSNISTVILGASKASQLKENIECLQHKTALNRALIEKVEELTTY